jgi:hypothetical protein
VVVEVRGRFPPPRPASPAAALASYDVETYLAVLREIEPAADRAAALAAALARRGIDRKRWEENGGRIVAAAMRWVPKDAPVPATWEGDLAVVEPFRDRILAALRG